MTKTESKYLRFEQYQSTGKTNVWQVMNKHSLDVLGPIKWYGPWRQYCFMPMQNTVHSPGCLRDIADFAERATRIQRASK